MLSNKFNLCRYVAAAITLIAVSTDPLAWVAGTAGSCVGTPAVGPYKLNNAVDP